jgi:hypothetical protein
MATTYLYGPYYVIEGPDTPFRPGEVRSYGFGPWRPFRDGTVTISANIQDFGRFVNGTTRAITIDGIEYFMADSGTLDPSIRFTYRNSGSEPIQAWYFNLSVVLP